MMKPTIHTVGCGGLLLDASDGAGVFDESLQQRVLRLGEILEANADCYLLKEILPGVNNLLVLFDPLACEPDRMRQTLLDFWQQAQPQEQTGRQIDIPVVYGGEYGAELTDLADAAGLSVTEYVDLHAQTEYSVACIGAMAGFAYLTGLPEQLHFARRATPRTGLKKGAVIIGGTQAGVMPVTAPSGWHAIGSTDVELFDPFRNTPCLLRAGDVVRFRLQGIDL